MKYEKSHYDEKTGEWKSVIVEEDGDFVFSTHTNVPIEKLKRKKNENRIPENQK